MPLLVAGCDVGCRERSGVRRRLAGNLARLPQLRAPCFLMSCVKGVLSLAVGSALAFDDGSQGPCKTATVACAMLSHVKVKGCAVAVP